MTFVDSEQNAVFITNIFTRIFIYKNEKITHV